MRSITKALVALSLVLTGCASQSDAEPTQDIVSMDGFAADEVSSENVDVKGGDAVPVVDEAPVVDTVSPVDVAPATDVVQPVEQIIRMNGTIVWTVDFSAEAEAEGYEDCSYEMTYEAFEDPSSPWLCVSCTQVFRASAQVVTGGEECHGQLGESPSELTEWFGQGGGEWYWSDALAFVMQVQGGGSFTDQNWTVNGSNEGTVGLSLPFTRNSTGSLSISLVNEGVDYALTLPESYSCGWPQADPPAYEGPFTLVEGQTLPDGVFIDQCGEAVRLHDLTGTYFILEIGALDCDPCQDSAALIGQFLSAMDDRGIPVQMVTMLVPSIYQAEGSVSQESVVQWANAFSLENPVLVDRGYTQVVAGSHFGTGLGYPTTVLVSPSLKVFRMSNGFSGWLEHEEAIAAHAASNPN